MESPCVAVFSFFREMPGIILHYLLPDAASKTKET
jgi:hypothetical protein